PDGVRWPRQRSAVAIVQELLEALDGWDAGMEERDAGVEVSGGRGHVPLPRKVSDLLIMLSSSSSNGLEVLPMGT
ncbi:unnamed protein product, partial [Urochloa humidicola]